MGEVHALVGRAAAAWPDAVAVVDDRGPLTFAELSVAVDQLTDALVARGVQPGHGLGVLARNGRDFIVGVFAGLGCGAVVLPISHQLTRAELDTLVGEAGLHAVLDDRSGEEPVRGGARDLPGGVWRLATGLGNPDAPMAPHLPDAAFVRFTSGTTGRSKGVVVGHQGVLARTAAAREALDLGPGDVVVWVLPMAYHFIVSIVAYVRYGVTIVCCPDMLARTVIAYTNRHAGTVLYAAPTHYRMLAADRSSEPMPTLRRAISTSAGVPKDVADGFAARFGVPLTQLYGIIEVGLPVGNLADAAGRPDAIGRALPGYEVGILHDDGTPVADGQPGHLALRGAGMFDGYLAPPQPVAEVLRHGWFWTGDLAVRDHDGVITVCGRQKSMINAAGLKVFPEEVEAVLEAHPAVAASRVRGEPHPMMGEVVVADLVARPGVPLDTDDVRRWCRERLSMHKVPQRLWVVGEIALTPTGKVQR